MQDATLDTTGPPSVKSAVWLTLWAHSKKAPTLNLTVGSCKFAFSLCVCICSYRCFDSLPHRPLKHMNVRSASDYKLPRSVNVSTYLSMSIWPGSTTTLPLLASCLMRKINNITTCCACVMCHRLFITFKTVKSDDNVIFKQSIKAYVTFVLTVLVWTHLDNFLFSISMSSERVTSQWPQTCILLMKENNNETTIGQ